MIKQSHKIHVHMNSLLSQKPKSAVRNALGKTMKTISNLNALASVRAHLPNFAQPFSKKKSLLEISTQKLNTNKS